MLGDSLEEDGVVMKGLSLLPVKTSFMSKKIRTRVTGTVLNVKGVLEALSGLPVEGYEIHTGVTVADESSSEGEDLCPVTQIKDSVSGQEKCDGCYRNNVYGTYIHGFFDNEILCNALVKTLAARKGIAFHENKVQSLKKIKNEQYDLLAQTVRKHIDLPYIYSLMDLESK